MKTKLFKRIGSFLLACMMVLGLSATAFAAEPAEVADSDTQIEVNSDVSVMANNPATVTVPAWQSRSVTVHLDSYLGITKKLHIKVTGTGRGAVDFSLYKDGNIKDDGNMQMGIPDEGDFSFTLPSSGDYTLNVANKSDGSITVTAQWK